jgi:hypothetical protein
VAVLFRCCAVHVAAQIVGFVTMPGGSSVRWENYDMGKMGINARLNSRSSFGGKFAVTFQRQQFSRPYSESALRAGARVHPCPTCREALRLSVADVARGYQCDSCARRDEGTGF